MAFLHDIFNNPFAKRALAQVDIPNWISDNLKLEQRPY
jgi:type III restriction enzyme